MPTKKSTKKTTKKDANEASLGQQWKNRLSPEILGQRIVRMHYMSKKNAEELVWYKRPLMLMLENGTWIIPQQDDEGNDGGAMWLMNEKRKLEEPLAPVITIADE